jgi:hypothetical protein
MDITAERIRVSADVYTYIDEEDRNLNLEVANSGGKKDDIQLQMTKERFSPETL